MRALFMGAPDSVAAMLDALQNGPPSARVSEVETEDTEPDPTLSDFRITG